LDNYVIEREFGKGGCVKVLLCKVSGKQKYVVIEFIHTTDSDVDMRLFRRENEIMKGLIHPNIVKYFDSFKDDENI